MISRLRARGFAVDYFAWNAHKIPIRSVRTPLQASLDEPLQAPAVSRACAVRLVLVTGGLPLVSELEVLASSNNELLLTLALLAFESQSHLLGRLRLNIVAIQVRDGKSAKLDER